jgi:hypothetical protein
MHAEASYLPFRWEFDRLHHLRVFQVFAKLIGAVQILIDREGKLCVPKTPQKYIQPTKCQLKSKIFKKAALKFALFEAYVIVRTVPCKAKFLVADTILLQRNLLMPLLLRHPFRPIHAPNQNHKF